MKLTTVGLVPLTLGFAFACQGKVEITSVAGNDGGGPASTGSSGSAPAPAQDAAVRAPAPYRLTCTFFTRDLSSTPPPEFAQAQAIFHTDERGGQFLDLAPGIRATVSLTNAPRSTEDVVLSVELPASGLKRTFQLAALVQPELDLLGGHGFSGLNYVATPNSPIDLQFVCEASAYDEPRPKPPPGPGSGPPPGGEIPGAPPPSRVPLSFRCDVAGAAGVQSVTFDRTAKREVVAGPAAAVNLDYLDGRSPVDPGFGESRSLVIQASRGALQPGAGWVTQVLYQLNAYQPLTNPLRGAAGMTGTIHLSAAAADAGANDDAGAPDAMTVSCTIP